MLVKIDRMFSDHYQFYIHDSNYDHFNDKRLEWNQRNRKKYGYMSTERAIYVSTVAGLNDHRIRIYLDEQPKEKYERIFYQQLNIESGTIVFAGIQDTEDDKTKIHLTPDTYKVFICSNSIGKDAYSYDFEFEDVESNEEYFKHDEFEYYDIYIDKM